MFSTDSGNTCGGFTVPNDHTSTGVADSDLVIYLFDKSDFTIFKALRGG